MVQLPWLPVTIANEYGYRPGFLSVHCGIVAGVMNQWRGVELLACQSFFFVSELPWTWLSVIPVARLHITVLYLRLLFFSSQTLPQPFSSECGVALNMHQVENYFPVKVPPLGNA